jgi:hypothetical protein
VSIRLARADGVDGGPALTGDKEEGMSRKARGEDSSLWKNADDFFRLAELFVGDDAGDLGKECIVTADADIDAGLKPRTPLADEDTPGRDLFTAEALHTEPLCIAIATVP